MKKKNIKGILGLIFGLLSAACSVCALLIPTNEIRGSGVRLHGPVNIWLGAASFALAILAIVFGVLGKKKHLPYRATGIIGVILGVFFLIASVAVTFGAAMFSMIADYANYGDESALGQSLQKDPENKAQIDAVIDRLLESASR